MNSNNTDNYSSDSSATKYSYAESYGTYISEDMQLDSSVWCCSYAPDKSCFENEKYYYSYMLKEYFGMLYQLEGYESL
ncbi:hypothetical protein CU098_005795, partial [Rhizopus stolonifer]